MKPTLSIPLDRPACLAVEERSHATKAGRPMRVRVGEAVPRLQLTAVVNGEYTSLDPSVLEDRWIALCFPPSLQGGDIDYLNRQATLLACEGVVLLAVACDEMLLRRVCRGETLPLTVPILTDPLHRLTRAYGIARHPAVARAKTFLIDPARILRCHVVHDLSTWNMEAVCGLIALTLERTERSGQVLMEKSQECHM